MTELPKEGAGRPLWESAPRIAPAMPAAPYLWAAVVSYPLAYFYLRKVLFASGFTGWGLPVFALLFVAGVEALARGLHRKPNGEAPLWAGCWLALSLGMWLWGYQPVLTDWQGLVWHLFAIWFVLARCGMLAQGYTGSLCFLDGLAGVFYLPFGNFFRRAATLWAGMLALAGRRGNLRRTGVGLLTASVTLLLCGMAWGLLSAVDTHFAALGNGLVRWLNGWLNGPDLLETFVTFLLSLPVGAWLYGLVAGGLRRQEPPCTEARFFARLAPLRRLPAITANVAVGALCAIYTLFFALQAAEWLAAGPLRLSAPAASDFAVDGFWELLRILLLDFLVLAVVRFLGRRALPRALAAFFCIYGVAFAALAGAKLVAYIRLYGYTPRRTVAGWFLCVLTLWAFLLLVRVFRRIPAARIGVLVLAVSFVALSCVDLESRIVQANIHRYEAGLDRNVDLDVLQECGLAYWKGDEDGGKRTTYTRWLLEAGWFQNRTVEDLEELYDLDGRGFGYEQQVRLDEEHLLRLTFDERWHCVGASLTQP